MYFPELARVNCAEIMDHWDRSNTGHLFLLTGFEWGVQLPPNCYLSDCWMVQRLTSRRLVSSRCFTPFDRSIRMYSRYCLVGLGLRPGKRPSVGAFAWLGTERSPSG